MTGSGPEECEPQHVPEASGKKVVDEKPTFENWGCRQVGEYSTLTSSKLNQRGEGEAKDDTSSRFELKAAPHTVGYREPCPTSFFFKFSEICQQRPNLQRQQRPTPTSYNYRK
jgi:hypothetical protein